MTSGVLLRLVYPFVHSEYVEQVQNELGLQHDIFTVHVMAATYGGLFL